MTIPAISGELLGTHSANHVFTWRDKAANFPLMDNSELPGVAVKNPHRHRERPRRFKQTTNTNSD